MNTVGPIPEPGLRDLLNAHRDEIMAGFNCHQTGTIVSFDATKQTAQVQLNVQRTVYNKLQTTEAQPNTPVIINYPVLVDVPVFFLTGGTARITMPMKAGDTCLVLFNDRDLDPWFTTGTQAVPNTSRMHSLADGLALVGFRSQANKETAYSANDVEVWHGTSCIRIKANGAVEISATDAKMEGPTSGNYVRIYPDGVVQFYANTTGAGGALAMTMTDKLHVGNGAGAGLLTALNLVITALTALNAKTGPSAVTQITAAQTAITDILS